MKTEIPQLTFTRFLAAISIVFFHYAAELFPFNIPAIHYFLSHANLGVCYFFVLSGFILAIVYDDKYFSKQGALKKFFLARFARIYPVYLIALLLALTSVWLYNREKFSGMSMISNALVLQAWIPLHLKTYNLPGWSLSVEAFFYITFPWLIYRAFKNLFHRSVIIAFTSWLLSFVLYLFVFNPSSPEVEQSTTINPVTNPLLQLNNFLIGIAGGMAFRQGRLSIIKKYSSLLLVISSLLMLMIFWIPNPLVENARDGLLAPLFLLFILSLSFYKGTFTRMLSNKYLIYLGDISYGVYILQAPLGMWFKGLLIKTGIIISETEFTYSFMVFLIFISALSYSYIEKPMREYLRTSKAREQKILTAVIK